MELSNAQQIVLRFPGNEFVRAAPGAGKTRLVAAKIQREIASAVNAGAEIACITYTNAARDEIAARLSSCLPVAFLEHLSVNTIHGFLLTTVLAPWSYLLDEFAQGFRLVTPGDPRHEEAIVAAAAPNESAQNALRKAARNYWLDIDGEPRGNDVRGLRQFRAALEARRYCDFAGVVYFSYLLLRRYETVRKAITNRFAWFLVDEYQDCNEVQLALYAVIAEAGATRFFLIGDLGQMIYGFNGVSKQSLLDTANALGCKLGTLRETYRCGPTISRAATRLGEGALEPTGEAALRTDALEILEKSTLGAGLHRFVERLKSLDIPTENAAAITPTNSLAISAALRFRELGVPAVVVSTPPPEDWYRRLLGALSAARRQIDSTLLALAEASLRLALNVTGLAERTCSPITERVVHDLVHDRLQGLAMETEVLEGAVMLTTATLTILRLERLLSPEDIEHFRAACRVEWRALREEKPVQTIGEMAERAIPCKSVRCMTIHFSKGLGFDAVALLGCDEGMLPFMIDGAVTDVDEDRRKFYVALTRARRFFLAISFNEPSRFIRQIGY